MQNPLNDAVETLRRAGHHVERTEFPPAPLPALFLVDGRELTERQLLDYASRRLTYPNGAPMFAPNGMMLDEHGNRSIFDDVDE